MIQRIQTLWMVLTAALMLAVLLMPSMYFSQGGDGLYRLHSYGVITSGAQAAAEKTSMETNGIISTPDVSVSAVSAAAGALIAVAALVPLIALFLYKKRKVQIRLLSVEFILIACSAALLGWHIYFGHKEAVAQAADYYFLFWPLLVFAAAPANWLALRGVVRDEALVRSVDRIR